MNANELAEDLEGAKLVILRLNDMLLQQQAEIEALKAGKIRAYDNGVEDGRKPNTNLVKELTRTLSVDEINEIIEHLNDLFVGKPMTRTEMDLLQHIVDHICNMANENQLLRIYNQEQVKPYSSNH